MADNDQIVTNHKTSSYNANSKSSTKESAIEILRKNVHKQQQIKQRKTNKDSLTTMCDEEEDEYLDEEDEELDEQAEEDNLPSSLSGGDDIKNLLNALSSGSLNGSIDETTLNAVFKLLKNSSSTATGQSTITNASSTIDSLNNNFGSIAGSPCSQTSNRHSSPVTSNLVDSATNSGTFAQLSSPVSSNCPTPMSIISTTGSNIPGRSKTFECKVCRRKFGYKHVLQNHERIHTGEKVCCSKLFNLWNF